MKQLSVIVSVIVSMLVGTVMAATNYVVTPGTPGVTPTANYTSWATAATNIQDAIDVVGSGGLVLVTNGTYVLTNMLTIANNITVRSFNNGAVDRDGTIIDGNYPAATNRCVHVDNVSAMLDGFTLTNGYATVGSLLGKGGGVFLKNGTVTNCLITGNESTGAGGGVWLDATATLTHSTISGNVATNGNASFGGGVYTWWLGGLVSDCIINDNVSNTGGGVFMRGANNALGSVLQNSTIANNEAIVHVSGQGSAGIGTQFKGTIDNCVISSNTTTKVVGTPYNAGVRLNDGCRLLNSLVMYNTLPQGGYGAGLTVGNNCIVSNCVIRNNSGGNGGGIHPSGTSLIVNSSIVSNSSASYSQGGTLRNCLVAYNDSGLWSHNSSGSRWENCTIVGHPGVGIRFSQSNTVVNCVVYSNNNGGANWSYDNGTTASNSTWTSSCTTPELTGPNDTGNIMNAPLFVDAAAGNYRLGDGSPCIDNGFNRAWMTNAIDLDGFDRIHYRSTTVDMGAYEYQLPPRGTMVSVR